MRWPQKLGMILLLGFGAVASARPFPLPKAVPPTETELREYIKSHWYAVRFDFPAASEGGASQKSTYVQLANDKCVRKDRRLFLCRFDATGQFESGRQFTQTIEIYLTRSGSGALDEVIIVQGD